MSLPGATQERRTADTQGGPTMARTLTSRAGRGPMTAPVNRPAVGRSGSGWYAAHTCGWIETGFETAAGATRILERHVAFMCAAPKCHHP